MNLTLSDEDAQQIAQALRRERDRLQTLLKDYQNQKKSTNASVHAMATEGQLNASERVRKLGQLAELIWPEPKPGSVQR